MKVERIEVLARQGRGKGAARRLRRGGLVPAVLYGPGGDRPVALRREALERILRTHHGGNALLEVLHGGTATPALLKEVQLHPLRGEPLHADLLEVAMDRPIRVSVEVRRTGADPVGFKKGGVLTHHLTEVEVECLPAEIPEALEVDLSGLDVGDSFHVSDIPDPGVRILTEGAKVLFTVVAPTVEKAAAEEAEAAAPAEEAAPAAPAAAAGKEGAAEPA